MTNAPSACNDVQPSQCDITLTTDASLTGWGCALENIKAGGQWLPCEAQFHINYLELKAVYFALQAFEQHLRGKHVRVMIDNTTAVACVSHMGTIHSDSCNEITHTIWHWCTDHNVWLSAAHIAGKHSRRH